MRISEYKDICCYMIHLKVDILKKVLFFFSSFIGFIIYSLLVVSVTAVLIVYYAPHYGNTNILVYIGICSLLGSFTVMGCKGIGVSLKEAVTYQSNLLLSWLTWLLLLIVIVCIVIQLNYLNRALDTFNTAVVTPIYYVFFTSAVIVASLVLFKEWGNMKPEDIVGNLCGFIVIVSGIFLLNAFKDMTITLANLPSSRKTENSSTHDDKMMSSMCHDDRQTLLADKTRIKEYSNYWTSCWSICWWICFCAPHHHHHQIQMKNHFGLCKVCIEKTHPSNAWSGCFNWQIFYLHQMIV